MTNKKITLSYPVKVIFSATCCGRRITFEDVDVTTIDIDTHIISGHYNNTTYKKVIENIVLIKTRRFRKEILKEDVHSVEIIKSRIIDNPYIK